MAYSEYLSFLNQPDSWWGENGNTMDPIQVLAAHHHLQYRLCDILIELARNPRHPHAETDAAAALNYLCQSMPLHEIDEDEDLRCAVEAASGNAPEIAGLFDLVARGHAADRTLAEPVCEGLAERALGRMPARTGAFVIGLYRFSESLRRHLQWEDWVVLPLAAEELSDKLRASLLTCMAQRRSEMARARRGRDSGQLAQAGF